MPIVLCAGLVVDVIVQCHVVVVVPFYCIRMSYWKMDRTCTCQLGGGCTTSPAFSRAHRQCSTSNIVQVVHDGVVKSCCWGGCGGVETGLAVDLSLTEDGQYQSRVFDGAYLVSGCIPAYRR